MKHNVVMLGVIAGLTVGGLAVGGFAAQEAETPRTEAPRVEERLARLEKDVRRLDGALQRSEITITTLSKQVKTLTEAQERLARAVSVDPSGAVRITGNLRLENNVLEDIRTVPCDAAATASSRPCTCPEGLVTLGIELRPLATSAYPGPATYNTALVCGRL